MGICFAKEKKIFKRWRIGDAELVIRCLLKDVTRPACYIWNKKRETYSENFYKNGDSVVIALKKFRTLKMLKKRLRFDNSISFEEDDW